MRKSAIWILMIIVAGWILVMPLRAATVVMAHGDAPRPQEWETLDVGVEMPAGGGTVGVRDARGGLRVVRTVAGGSGETMHVWMPLPFLQASDLPNNEWAVDVTVTPVGRAPATQRLVVRRPAEAAWGTFRVAVVEGAETEAMEKRVAWTAITPRPVIFARVSADEVLTGPPLGFAGFDAVLLSPALRAKLEETRALDLLSAGVRLVVVREGAATSGGGIGRLPWAQVNGSPAWIVPREPLRRPTILEPALEESLLAPKVEPSRALRLTVMLVAPMGIVMVLIARGLFKHRAWVFGGAALGLGIVAAAGVMVTQQIAPPASRRIEWTEMAVGRAAPSASVLALTETVRCVTPVLSQRRALEEDDRAVLCPMAPSLRAYFSWRDATLSLGGAGDGSQDSATVTLPARESFALLGRSVSLTHVTSTDGWWLEDGYIAHANASASIAPEERQLFTEWLGAHAGPAETLRPWYALRYQPHHQYLLHTPADATAAVTIEDRGLPLDYRNTP